MRHCGRDKPPPPISNQSGHRAKTHRVAQVLTPHMASSRITHAANQKICQNGVNGGACKEQKAQWIFQSDREESLTRNTACPFPSKRMFGCCSGSLQYGCMCVCKYIHQVIPIAPTDRWHPLQQQSTMIICWINERQTSPCSLCRYLNRVGSLPQAGKVCYTYSYLIHLPCCSSALIYSIYVLSFLC